MFRQLRRRAVRTALRLHGRRPLRPKDIGAALVEYALLLALIAVVAIGALLILGHTVNNTFNSVAAQMGSTGSGSGSPTSTAPTTTSGVAPQFTAPTDDYFCWIHGFGGGLYASPTGATRSYNTPVANNAINITATGTPLPTINDTVGAPPPNYSFVATAPGAATISQFSFNGNWDGTATLTAVNGSGSPTLLLHFTDSNAYTCQ